MVMGIISIKPWVLIPCSEYKPHHYIISKGKSNLFFNFFKENFHSVNETIALTWRIPMFFAGAAGRRESSPLHLSRGVALCVNLPLTQALGDLWDTTGVMATKGVSWNVCCLRQTQVHIILWQVIRDSATSLDFGMFLVSACPAN